MKKKRKPVAKPTTGLKCQICPSIKGLVVLHRGIVCSECIAVSNRMIDQMKSCEKCGGKMPNCPVCRRNQFRTAVLRGRFPVERNPEWIRTPLQTLAIRFQVTRERVRQIEGRMRRMILATVSKEETK
jgi:hypothetical protein